MKVKLIVDGGKMQAGPSIAQQLGPMGINLGKLIADINETTKGFIGMKVPIEIDVDPRTKKYSISVFSPTVAELLKKELKIEAGSGRPNTIKVGNIAFERIVAIAEKKIPDLLAKDLKSACKLVVGTCVSLGVLIDNKEPNDIQTDIDDGKYDREIKEKITSVSEEKKEKLEKFFSIRKAKQEKEAKALAEAEAAKAAAAPVAKTGEATPAIPLAVPSTTTKKEEPKKAETKKK